MHKPELAWYQHAIFYGLDVSTFRDGNGDGIGDFPGLAASLDYLSWLGVDAVWLLPFFPSALRDNGYDITDHYGVDPTHGTMPEVVAFLGAAKQRGIRVIIDLVVNHTSDQHMWFQEARKDRASPYHDYYVWTDDPGHEPEHQEVFPGIQHGVWTYVPEVNRHYLHHFYDFEPELNTNHPAVRQEIRRIVQFWLRLGIDGFRIDSAPFLGNDKQGDIVNPHILLRNIRQWTSAINPDTVLIAEADLPSPELEPYFGEGASCQLIFSFVVNQALYLALVDEQAGPLINAIRRLPQPPPGCGWLGYLRNLDELTLSRLSDDERTRVVAALAPDPDMQIYGRGIRRRLAPMLDGNQDRLKLTMSLLFSLPYPPMVAYGEEIGMGDDLSLPERYSVRLPMQWSGRARNAGFSDAPQASMLRHVPHADPYRPGKINVEDQQQDAQSLLHWVRRLIAERKQRQALFEGAWSLIKTGEPAVLVQKSSAQRRFLITAHNLSPQAKDVSIPMPEGDLPWIVLEHPSGCTLEWDGRESTLHLPGYGTSWLVQEPAPCAEPATENKNASGEAP